MHLSFISTRGQAGLDAPSIIVEVHLSAGLPAFQVVGLGDSSSREIRSRVRAALISSHLKWPDFNITVNLTPAERVTPSTRFDLPIAIGLLVASQQLPRDAIEGREFIGELGLDGCLKPSRGALAAVLAAAQTGNTLCLATEGSAQMANVEGSRLIAAPDLLSLCASLKADDPQLVSPRPTCPADTCDYPDLSQIRGQPLLYRALELAAAGGHHLLMSGSPGVGKTLAASVLPGLLPPIAPATQQEMWLIRDLVGLSRVSGPTFRAPHHSSSIAALMGGTAKALPGEISMAHGGVLFLDELTEFPRAVLNQLRQPLESGEITVTRAEHQHCYPARFQLVAAMNPCPCGLADNEDGSCRCSPDMIRRYRQGASGPLMDRIDLHVKLSKPSPEALLSAATTDNLSARLRERVAVTREQQLSRQGCLNRDLAGDGIVEVCALNEATRASLIEALTALNVSARSAHRRLRVARTLADLAGEERVSMSHINTALSFREVPTGVGAV
jgi:magnesium chelatase family protein